MFASPAQLSGGQQQRVAIAPRADPRAEAHCLPMKPTSALDAETDIG